MQMDLGKALLDPAHHLFIPLELQVRMQAALHKHACPAQFDCLADLFVNGLEIQHIALGSSRSLDRRVEGAESAVLRTEIGVINVTVNDVSDHPFRMVLSADGHLLPSDATPGV